MSATTIPLRALSNRQSRLVERHIPLVHLTIRRLRANQPAHSRFDPRELTQEGCLALLEAVRTHDPHRHGDFPAFAMARIHHAVRRFQSETAQPVRIPYITQRRLRARRHARRDDRCHPAMRPPRIRHPRRLVWEAPIDLGELPSARPASSIGDLVRLRYDRAMAAVVSLMRDAPGTRCSQRQLVELCRTQRWGIPEPAARTSLREIADRLGCSLGRVTHCDAVFRRRLAAHLTKDRVYRKLMRIARQHPAGLNHRPSADERRRM